MSLALLLGLLLFVRVDAQVKGCSNPGVYVTEEGQPVEICFTFYNNNPVRFSVPETVQVVNFVTESTSTLGIVASKNVDYVNKNTSVPIPFSDQDVFQVCEPIQTNTDLVVERTEYFTVQLQGPKGVLMASCQVAIIDTDGGPSECYQSAVTRGGLPVLGWVFNDPAFCLTKNSTSTPQKLTSQCRLDPRLPLADCTNWNPTNVMAMTTFIASDQIFPDIAAIGQACVESVISGLNSLYRDTNGNLNSQPISGDCATNCVLTVRDEQTCDTSVLLLEQVYRQEAVEFLNKLRNGGLDSCVVGLDCCGDLSLAIPPICSESSPLSSITTMAAVTEDVLSQNQAIGTVVAVAVLGTILGLVLIVGATVITVFILYRCRDDAHKAIVSALRALRLPHLVVKTNKVDGEGYSEAMPNIGNNQVAELHDTTEHNTLNRGLHNTMFMNNNNAYLSSTRVITIENNIAYCSQIMKNEDEDYVYDYI